MGYDTWKLATPDDPGEYCEGCPQAGWYCRDCKEAIEPVSSVDQNGEEDTALCSECGGENITDDCGKSPDQCRREAENEAKAERAWEE
jgi:hypothetical protein